jgi:LDH2 family malate/lactate/ureidoglycolate dehydrogenase
LPAGREGAVVFDMATTVVSYGTIKNYALQGRELPEGWFINRKDGTALTDPRRSDEGLLLPIGGYKGSGLAIMLGLLAGTLNGAAFGRDVVDFNADSSSECNTGHFLIAVDIARFIDLGVFKSEVDRHLADLRNSDRLPGFDAIRLPGERRRECKSDRTRNGVPLAPPLLVKLDDLADELGIDRLRQFVK